MDSIGYTQIIRDTDRRNEYKEYNFIRITILQLIRIISSASNYLLSQAGPFSVCGLGGQHTRLDY